MLVLLKQMAKNKKELDLQKALEVLFASEYINHHKLYLHNFIRGVFFGAGSLMGATVVIAFVLWVLSIFDSVPLIGPLIDSTKESIEKR